MDKSKISEAGQFIQMAWSSGNEQTVRKAIAALEAALGDEATNAAIPIFRSDKLPADIKKPFLSTGLGWLDEILGGGLRQQELMLIGGVPHQGKTHLMVFLASAYLAQGATVLHFNGEDLVGDVLEIYEKALQVKRPEGLFVADVQERAFSIASINATIGSMEVTPDFVVVDYIDLIEGTGGEADWLNVSSTTKALRGLAKKYGTTVITGTQLNFPSDSSYGRRGPRRSAMGRLYRSKVGKAMSPDVMLLLHESDGGYYAVELAKGRGRKIKNKFSNWECDFDTMEITGEVEREV
jgi:predicted ATP-dependent serine protease